MASAVALSLAAAVLRPAAADAQARPGGAERVALYVFNRTKLEAARAASPPPEPKRIAQLEAWRRNDMGVMALLRSLGFTVREADEHAPAESLRGVHLIFISESVDAIEVGGKYRDTPIPLLTCENDLLGDLEMTGQKSGRDYGTDDDQRFVWIVNAPHPLAAGLSPGLQNVMTDEHYKMNWGRPCNGAIMVATLRGEPEKAAIFAYERGATMSGEFIAPARRVSFFLWQDMFEGLRPEGLALLKAAVLWAAGPR